MCGIMSELLALGFEMGNKRVLTVARHKESIMIRDQWNEVGQTYLRRLDSVVR